MQPIDSIIFGDNQFFGINVRKCRHPIEKKYRNWKENENKLKRIEKHRIRLDSYFYLRKDNPTTGALWL